MGVEGVVELQRDMTPFHHHNKRFSGLYTGPYFDPSMQTNITTQLGTHAYLPCKVKQLGNKSVSINRIFPYLQIIISLKRLSDMYLYCEFKI